MCGDVRHTEIVGLFLGKCCLQGQKRIAAEHFASFVAYGGRQGWCLSLQDGRASEDADDTNVDLVSLGVIRERADVVKSLRRGSAMMNCCIYVHGAGKSDAVVESRSEETKKEGENVAIESADGSIHLGKITGPGDGDARRRDQEQLFCGQCQHMSRVCAILKVST
tara:strand:+ start:389 stop:886 length:498 start_codon:yes stop_codon:yes gene_type:complete